MRRRLTLLGAVAVALAVSACGGAPEPKLYELEPTRSCLEESDLRVTDRGLDFVAKTALAGAMRVRFRDIRVTMTFGETEDEATRTEQAYRRFAPKRFPIDDVLRRDRNVVMLWQFSPKIEHLETMGRCLRS